MILKKYKINDLKNYGNISVLIPVESSIEEYKKIKIGQEINVKWEEARNIKHHRKLFGILNFCIENFESEYKSVETLLLALKYEAGYVKRIKTFDNQIIIIPDSINFDKLGQKKFEKIYLIFLEILSKYFGVSIEMLEGNESN